MRGQPSDRGRLKNRNSGRWTDELIGFTSQRCTYTEIMMLATSITIAMIVSMMIAVSRLMWRRCLGLRRETPMYSSNSGSAIDTGQKRLSSRFYNNTHNLLSVAFQYSSSSCKSRLFYFIYLNISGKGQKPLTCR